MTTIDFFNIKQELVVFLRNSDVMTITERGVTTQTDETVLTAASSTLINRSNVRNIRSVEGLTFGEDYTVDYFFDDSGTRKCKIIFESNQTGTYDIVYDFGSDKIYPDDPQETATIEDFPQIRVDILSTQSEQAGLGNEIRTNITIEVKVYGANKTYIQNYMTSIRSSIVGNATGFYYVGPYIHATLTSPILKNAKFSNKIFQQTGEFQSPFITELN